MPTTAALLVVAGICLAILGGIVAIGMWMDRRRE